jgi:DNA gyrase subunit A
MKVSDISEQGRATQGVKLIRLDEGDEIAGITRLEVEEMNGNGHDQVPGNGEIPPGDSADGYGNQATNPSKDSSEESTEI